MAFPTTIDPAENDQPAPANRYRVADVPVGQVTLISDEADRLLDPCVVLSAQLSFTLRVCGGREFDTNMPKLVNDDFLYRVQHWKAYVDRGTWQRLIRCDKPLVRLIAASIRQEYRSLYELGKAERCTFGLENIFIHLQELIRLEAFFFNLTQQN